MNTGADKAYERLLDEAAAWIVRLRSSDVTSADKSSFSLWLNTSAEHLRAFDEMSETWDTLGAVTYVPDIEQHIQPTTPGHSGGLKSLLQRLGRGLQMPVWRGSIAAAMAFLLYLVFLNQPTPVSEQRFSTAAGGFREVQLADGSSVTLNTNTTVRVLYTDDSRQLWLERGEAYFAVAKNPNRPFIVDVGSGQVKALGTAFDIDRRAKSVRVVVTEGKVEVSEKEDPTTPLPRFAHVVADQQVSFDQHGLGSVRSADVARSLAWREQQLVFDGVPLSEALDELNRYLDKPVDNSDPSLDNIRVSGTFGVDHPEDILNAMIASFDLKEDHQDDVRRVYRH